MKINDTLICINASPLKGNDVAPPLVGGNDYPLKEVHVCSCGKEHFNVGLPMEYNFVRCFDCQEELPKSNHWCHPSRFIVK